MKKRWMKLFAAIALIVIVVGGIVGFINFKLNNSTINIREEDFNSMVNALSPYLITAGVLILLVLVILIISRKASKRVRNLILIQSIIAIILIVVVVGNMIIFGPANKILSLSLSQKYALSEETSAESGKLGTKIVEEGIVLLKNEDNILPFTSSNKKINVFGWSSTNPIYGGTGSGTIDTSKSISLLDSLKNTGYEVNSELVDFYTSYRSSRPMVGMFGQDWTIPEPKIEEYQSAGILEQAKEFSDTALIVISRSGGEGADLPRSITDKDNLKEGGMFGMTGVRYTSNPDDVAPDKHYLELSNREEEMVKNVTSEFDNVVVIVNSANPMELGWLDEYSSIKGALWYPGPGITGFSALGGILNGTVNPSGKLPDTYVYDLLDTPTANNYGNFAYDNMADVINSDDSETNYQAHFTNYVEGIYVGYKFYETAAAEGLIDYESKVQYPFGYGLSYTDFEQEISEFTQNNNAISLDVTVTNTGNTAGKEVVEAYYTPPYHNGGIEKAEVNLVEFTKTNNLAPGESQTVTLNFDLEDMASYDYENYESYLLEQGDYNISIRSDANTVIESRNINIGEDIVYNEKNDGGRSDDVETATNQFDHAYGNVTYLSREDGFANYEEATAVPSDFSLAEEFKNDFLAIANYNVEEHNDSSDQMPVTGEDNDLDIRDVAGLDYDAPQWEQLLDQLSTADMNKLIALGGYSTSAVNIINAPRTVSADGPAGLNNNFSGQSGTGFPTAVLIASTWNKELAYNFGIQMGKEAEEMHVTGWYAPSMNIHRSSFLGRSFEYYSEDPYLSGAIAAKSTKGAEEKGLVAYIKHFALNDQETNRTNMLATWADEQTIREVYLKPFEMSVKEGGATGAMSAFNYIGNRWAGASSSLLNGVLRDEWGFRGHVITDYFMGDKSTGFMDADIAIRNGNDLMLSTTGENGAYVDDTESATSILAMRDAAHNILYSVANSNAMAPENFQMEDWVKAVIAIDAIIAIILLAFEILYFRKYLTDNKKVV